MSGRRQRDSTNAREPLRVALVAVLLLLALVDLAVGQVAGSGNLELFRARLSEPATSYRLEFLEGNVHQNTSTKVERIAGRMTIRQSQRQYHAVYQQSGFRLSQVPESISLGGFTNVSLFVDCGRNDRQGWVQRDSAFVRLADLDVVSTDPTVQTIVDEVKRRENMVCCACFYGFPPIDTSAIKWDGLHFVAPAVSGGVVNGSVGIDPTNGLVSGAVYATYDTRGEKTESGTVRYAYSDKQDASAMPDVIEKFTSQLADPLGAARNSFVIKITEREARRTLSGQSEFNPSSAGLYYMISNGIPLTKVAGRFLSKGELHSVRDASQPGGGSATSNTTTRVVVVFMLISSLILLGWLAGKQKGGAKT